MSTKMLPMSSSYKVIFVLSIIMMFVVLLGGAASGSKSSGSGILVWGYTAWLMYKRNNVRLVLLQKILLWFEGVAFSVGFLILVFSNSDMERLVGVSAIELLVLGSISMSITYGLLAYFKKQINNANINVNDFEIQDKYWEQSSVELQNSRNEAVWAKSFANSNGDEAKAKAFYLKYRAESLQRQNSINNSNDTKIQVKEDLTSVVERKPSDFFGTLGKYLFIIFFVLMLAFVYFITNDSKSSSGVTLNQTPSASFERSDSYKSDVSKLRNGIKSREIPVFAMDVEVISSKVDVFDKPWSRYRIVLPKEQVDVVESQNIWWVEENNIFIRLHNPTAKDVLGFAFSLSQLQEKILLSIELKVPLKPYHYAIYSSALPFDFLKSFSSGIKQGDIVMVLGAN
jgi:hypothetical protein